MSSSWFPDDGTEVLDKILLGKEPIYRSASIFERRRRVMREAISLISEKGYDNFGVRELARRANVAQRTIYTGFGSCENVIISAIYQYRTDFYQHVNFDSSPATLLGFVERTAKVHSRNLMHRSYINAVMSIYNSLTADPSLRQAISKMAHNGSLPYAEHLYTKRYLSHGMTPEKYSRILARAMYATLSAWSAGEMPDDSLVDSMVRTFLMVTLTSTKGVERREAGVWLGEVLSDSPRWKDLKVQWDVAYAREVTVS